MSRNVNLSDTECRLIVQSLAGVFSNDEHSAKLLVRIQDKLGGAPDHVLDTVVWDVLELLKDEDGEIVFGLPNRSGEYLITTKSGSVATDFFDVDDGLFENYDLSEIYAVAEMPVGAKEARTRRQTITPV